MIKILFYTILRHLNSNKAYTAINIVGLAIGIGCSLVIYKIIAYESGFDSYQTNYENIYRLITEYQDPIEGTRYEEGQVPIVGVVEDFHAQSLQKSMENVIFGNFGGLINEMAIKINPTNLNQKGYRETIKKVQSEWDGVFPNDIMNSRFFDEKIASLYKEEKNTSNLIQLFALIAILISSLGLYGLISYIISQKSKEITIRKVNGAKVSEILVLLNKDFMIYFAIAFVIACPLAFISMDKWLENFAYKTILSWWIFALAGVLVLAIALLTVSWQSWNAARRNPIEALRYE